METYSIYLHIPFCERRCSYCDFNTYAGMRNRMPQYVNALCQEIETVAISRLQSFEQADSDRLPIHTIYFGGGTPSLLPAYDLQRIMAVLRQNFQFLPEMEITLEANPGTLSPEYLENLRGMGINRLSIGMQSASNAELKMLGRIHSFEAVQQSVIWAREAGFNNLSLDLIYGLPDQTIEHWNANLQAALAFGPEHLSLYALTLEPEVPMFRQIQRGLLAEQNDDLMADMYEHATEMLERDSFEQYEISNWSRRTIARRDFRSRHNLQYWLNLPYLGFGAGAHGYADGVRTENLLRINSFIQRCISTGAGQFPCGPALKTSTTIDRRREMQETMLLGLRLMQGISKVTFQERFDTPMEIVFGDEIDRMLKLDLLEQVPSGAGSLPHSLKLTRRGRFLSNEVFRQFVD